LIDCIDLVAGAGLYPLLTFRVIATNRSTIIQLTKEKRTFCKSAAVLSLASFLMYVRSVTVLQQNTKTSTAQIAHPVVLIEEKFLDSFECSNVQ
jgi:hypothetical protein